MNVLTKWSNTVTECHENDITVHDVVRTGELTILGFHVPLEGSTMNPNNYWQNLRVSGQWFIDVEVQTVLRTYNSFFRVNWSVDVL